MFCIKCFFISFLFKQLQSGANNNKKKRCKIVKGRSVINSTDDYKNTIFFFSTFLIRIYSMNSLFLQMCVLWITLHFIMIEINLCKICYCRASVENCLQYSLFIHSIIPFFVNWSMIHGCLEFLFSCLSLVSWC